MTHMDHDPGLGLGHELPDHQAHELPAATAGSDLYADQIAPAFSAGWAEAAAVTPAAESQPGSAGEIGNPAEYQGYWFNEEMNGFCAPASITQVIEAQSGITIHDYSVIQQEANHLGMSLDGNGTLSIVQAQELLSGFGINSHLYAAPTPSDAMSQLENFLAGGRNIVLSVNAGPIWGTGDDGQPDHALVVTAVDPRTQTVTLSDPGTAGGNEEQVSFQDFEAAWSASDYTMLVTDDAAGGLDHAAAVASVDEAEQASGVPAFTGPWPSDLPGVSGPDGTGLGEDSAGSGAHLADAGNTGYNVGEEIGKHLGPGSVLIPIVGAAVYFTGRQIAREIRRGRGKRGGR